MHKSGGKITGNHTTVTDLGYDVVGVLEGLNEVKKIGLGFINPLNNRRSAERMIKIIDDYPSILVKVTQKGSKQDLRVYSDDLQSTKLVLSRWTRDNGYGLRFGRYS